MVDGMIDLDEIHPEGQKWMNKPIQQDASLLRFTNPYIMQNKFAKKPPVTAAPKILESFTKCSTLLSDMSIERQGVLDLISPPRIWEEGDETWIQKVSPQRSHRCQIHLLRNKIDKLLDIHRVRDFGICPKRIMIYTQAFDELIRQVTITCAEQGIMLLRVREELKMTFSSYKVMFEDSVVYSDKLICPLEDALVPLYNEKRALLSEIEALKQEQEALINSYDIKQRRVAEERFIAHQEFKDEMRALKRTKLQLKKLLYLIKSPETKMTETAEPEVDLEVPFSAEIELNYQREAHKSKEKTKRKDKKRAIRFQRIKKVNEKMRRLFETDFAVLVTSQNLARAGGMHLQSDTDSEGYVDELSM